MCKGTLNIAYFTLHYIINQSASMNKTSVDTGDSARL